MKKRLLAAALVAVMILSMTACGGSGAPTEQDAKDCLQATLDLVLTGEYDENYEFADMGRDEAMKMRSEMFEEGFSEAFLGALDLGVTLSEEDQNELTQSVLAYSEAGIAKVKYTIGDCEQNDDGYSFNVTFETPKLFDIDEDTMREEGMEDKALEYMEANKAEFQALSTEEQQAKIVLYLLDLMMEKLNADLENPTYVDPVETTIQVDVDENNQLMVDEDSLSEAIGDMLDGIADV